MERANQRFKEKRSVKNEKTSKENHGRNKAYKGL